MKKVILSSMLSVIVILSYAQKGASQLNLGVGFSNWGVPVYIGFDHRVSNDISLGLELSYRGYNERYNGNDYNHNITGCVFFTRNCN